MNEDFSLGSARFSTDSELAVALDKKASLSLLEESIEGGIGLQIFWIADSVHDIEDSFGKVQSEDDFFNEPNAPVSLKKVPDEMNVSE